ncbi:arsenate reductase ArsC [Leifsonia shinshuensis]|uniref:arsenate reductase/protein-tyrosine-phosphatase family protein n=1 Tax=Leifsonia shinshuensis TaxID=150026 RepID=UPI001F506FAC|nr:arsenate reductase ArsC [Leifsonia shinshuensis]MCI0157104.1 arsenate reductase ArsC [Leifsonia shinshuensis]
MTIDATGRRSQPELAYPESHLRRLADELAARYDGVFNRETVERYVLESYAALLRTASVKAHLATRTMYFATERLTALAQAEGALPVIWPEVLFVCEQNSGRSQMAAVLTEALSGGRVHVRSAGSMPAHELNPAVVEAMTEIGLDLSREFPKPLTDDVVRAADVVVTMGCGDACPIYAGKRYQDWELQDPQGQPVEIVRGIRDEVEQHVRDLLKSLEVAPE